MTVGRVKDFSFPRSGPTQVRGYMRGGEVEKAAGGIVKPPASGIRAPRPASAVKAQKYVEGMAARPGRGPRVGAKLAVAKSAAAPAMGALQNASTPMITPPAVPTPAMARGGRLNAAARKALPASKFAGPNRSFPVPDKSHAGNAKARASQAVNAGRMTRAQAMKIDAKADRVLGEKD